MERVSSFPFAVSEKDEENGNPRGSENPPQEQWMGYSLWEKKPPD
jgi:hypothetical protein